MFHQPPKPAQRSKTAHDPRLPAAYLLWRSLLMVRRCHKKYSQTKPTQLVWRTVPKQTEAMARHLLSDCGIWVQAYIVEDADRWQRPSSCSKPAPTCWTAGGVPSSASQTMTHIHMQPKRVWAKSAPSTTQATLTTQSSVCSASSFSRRAMPRILCGRWMGNGPRRLRSRH